MKSLRVIIAGVCCVMTMMLNAETRIDRVYWSHEVRVGWGDQLFETLMWNKPAHIVNTLPASYNETYHENYRYYQHLWAEYQYRINDWFSGGGMLDLSGVSWDDVMRNGTGTEIARDAGHYFCNAVLMPTVRFTYLHHEYVNLYSGLGLGMGINTGTEKNSRGHRTDVGAAFNITLIGLSVNYQRWFVSVEGGGMYSLKNLNTIFLVSSRIISVGIGARF